MPNWMMGQLRIRGSADDLHEFVSKCFYTHEIDSNFRVKLDTMTFPFQQTECDDDQDSINFGSVEPPLYVSGLYMAYISSGYLEAFKSDKGYVLAVEFQQPWIINADQLLNVCQKYNLDMRIHAFEMGTKVEQDIDIENGTLINNVIKEHDPKSWWWDADFPLLGG